jgi:hypothetical protein
MLLPRTPPEPTKEARRPLHNAAGAANEVPC